MKNKYKKIIILILILSISIGFAYLSATLNIAGLIGYKGNSWNIYFDNVQMIINDVEGVKPTINNNKDTVNFNISFSEPSEVYRFSVDVVNDGTLDAMIGELTKTGITASNSDYIDYSITYSNGSNVAVDDLLAHGSKVRLIVNVEYKNTTERIAPTGVENYSLTVKYIQANDNARKVETILESGHNTTFVLNNAKANTLSNLKIYGDSSQTTYTGQNLYNVNDFKTGSGTVDSDGWITISYNNSGGTGHIYEFYCTHDLDLITSHQYTIVVEIKSVSGTGAFRPFSTYNNAGQFVGPSHYFSELSNNSINIYTPTVRSEVVEDQGLRTHVDFSAGDSGSITFRISVIDSTSITKNNFVYEPYVGGMPSPNPDYPQDVHSVTDNVNVKITNNLSYFPYENKERKSSGVSTYNLDFEIVNGYSSIISGTATGEEYRVGNRWDSKEVLFNVKPNTTYYYENNLNINCQITVVDTTNNTYRLVDIGSGDSFVTSSTETGISSIRIYVRTDVVYDNTLLTYIIYEKNEYYLSLENIELYKINDYKDYIYNKDGEWYVHRNIINRNFNSENGALIHGIQQNGDASTRQVISYVGSARFYLTNNNMEDIVNTKLYSNKLTYKYYNTTGNTASFSMDDNTMCLRQGSEMDRLYIKSPLFVGLDGNAIESALLPVSMYYVTNNPTDEKITDTTLIGQLNNLINSNLFDGTNYITVTGSDLIPTIDFDYETE